MRLTERQVAAVYGSGIGCVRNHDVGVEDLQALWDILSADLIERCALVAENWPKDTLAKVICDGVAAAIRALKDKP